MEAPALTGESHDLQCESHWNKLRMFFIRATRSIVQPNNAKTNIGEIIALLQNCRSASWKKSFGQPLKLV